MFEISVNFLILYHFSQSESTTSPQFENFNLQNEKYKHKLDDTIIKMR
jgi:hypothetical protein